MENEILYNLGEALSAPIEREAEVFYLLVEIRKLLELAGRKEEFEAIDLIRFECGLRRYAHD